MDTAIFRQLGIVSVLLTCTCAHANSVDVFKRSTPLVKKESINEDAGNVPKIAEYQEIEPVKLVEKKIVLQGKGLFDHESHSLGPNSEQVLLSLVSNLEELKNVKSISVLGHTDSSGKEKTNLRISIIRADSVQAFLQGAYPEIPVIARGMGETRPAFPNSTLEGRERNRRVEILISVEESVE